MSRWKAAAIHLTLSVIIATGLVAIMLALWYPPPYFQLMGGLGLVALIAGCDVVLGPLLTLVVFKSGKKSLKFDLAVIAVLQMAAMTYGLFTMFEARPVYTVFVVDRFEVVAANDIQPEELAKVTRPEFASLPLTGPRLVGAMLPLDPNDKLGVALSSMVGGGDVKTLPRLYVPYNWIASDAVRKSKPLESLRKRQPDVDAKLGDTAARQPGADDGLAYLPLVGRFRSMTAVLDRKSGSVRSIIDVDPW